MIGMLLVSHGRMAEGMLDSLELRPDAHGFSLRR